MEEQTQIRYVNSINYFHLLNCLIILKLVIIQIIILINIFREILISISLLSWSSNILIISYNDIFIAILLYKRLIKSVILSLSIYLSIIDNGLLVYIHYRLILILLLNLWVLENILLIKVILLLLLNHSLLYRMKFLPVKYWLILKIHSLV